MAALLADSSSLSCGQGTMWAAARVHACSAAGVDKHMPTGGQHILLAQHIYTYLAVLQVDPKRPQSHLHLAAAPQGIPFHTAHLVEFHKVWARAGPRRRAAGHIQHPVGGILPRLQAGRQADRQAGRR